MNRIKSILFLVIFISAEVFAQFGQNRVQYKEYDWHYIQTKHFDLYFTMEGKISTEFCAAASEAALADIEKKLNYKINSRISLLLYNSHNDFQETNTSDSYVSQGIGGFTEPFKNRVVVPFEGDYAKFKHVIHHELVHAVMRDMLYGGTVQNIISKGITLNLPIWYHEGMAEYISSDWETNSDMFIRDAIINEYLPDINNLGGYFAYRGGQSLMLYISEKYGIEKIAEILSKTQGLNNLEEGIKASIGLTIEELNEQWKKDLKKKYWPDIVDRKDPDEFSKRLTDNKKTGGFYNTSPAISPQGDKVIFISDRDIYLGIYLMSAYDGKIIDRVIESGRTTDFEELNVLTPALTWSPDNKHVALSVKSDGYDRIRVIEVEENDSYELDFKLGGISSVSWSPKGDEIAFVGHNPSQSDIYVYNLNEKKLYNITNDIFTDSDPSWSSNGEKIFFASDRGEYYGNNTLPENFEMIKYSYGQSDIYSIDKNSKDVKRYTKWKFSNQKNPLVSPDSKSLLFISDKNGINNVYRLNIDNAKNLLEKEPLPITNSLNQIDQISISADGKKMVFTSLYNSGYNIYLIYNPFTMETNYKELKPTKFMVSVINKGTKKDTTIQTYKNLITKAIPLGKPDTTFIHYVFGDNENTKNETKTKEKTVTIFTGDYVKADTTNSNSFKNPYNKYKFVTNAYGDTINTAENRAKLFSEKLDEDGNYLVYNYKINFSPDIVSANAGYDTFYGLLGSTVLSFSDMLGNHRLIGYTGLKIDLKDSDYGLSYYYLAKKIDYGIQTFHTSRLIRSVRRYPDGKNFLEDSRYRNYGVVLSMSYPLNRFYRLEGGLSYLNVSSENLTNLSVASKFAHYIIPSVGFVHDNTLWGYYSPIEGVRYKLMAFGNPGISKSKRSFYSLTFDLRKYMRFWFDNSFVLRLSGGYSGGANPQRFMLGGISNWINREFSTEYVPIDDVSDFAFLTPAMPMRGYDYARQLGTKYALLNIELRMPVIRYLVTGPLPLLLRNILGNVFLDVGSAWNENSSLKLFGRDESGDVVTKDLLIGTGTGIRTFFLFALFRLDVAWQYNGKDFSKPRYYFSLGIDF